MAYWRMQLHPNNASEAVRHAVQSLAAGYIGLDFAEDSRGFEQNRRGSNYRKSRNRTGLLHMR